MPLIGDAKRAYQRTWLQKRRSIVFDGRQCVKCGGMEKLELDHIDPTQKISHSIWSWSEERRTEELAKCQILCKKCHQKKTSQDNDYGRHGVCGYRRGCRCGVCTAEKTKEVNEYRARRKRKLAPV